VIAVGRDDIVVGPQHAQRAGADGFLSDVQVAEPADLAERVRLGAALLEAALQQHGAQKLHVEGGITVRLRIGFGLLLYGHEKSEWSSGCAG
jgi:hypothetical protein